MGGSLPQTGVPRQKECLYSHIPSPTTPVHLEHKIGKRIEVRKGN